MEALEGRVADFRNYNDAYLIEVTDGINEERLQRGQILLMFEKIYCL